MKKLSRILCLFLALLLLTSCTNGKSEDNTTTQEKDTTEEITTTEEVTTKEEEKFLSLFANGKTEYTIIVAETGTSNYQSWINTLAMSFKSSFKTLTGATITIGDDYLGRNEEEKADAKEIVIGTTTRSGSIALSSELAKKSYIIKVIDNRLFILGADKTQLQKAIDYLLATYFEEGATEVKIPQNLNLSVTDETLYVSIFGDSISTYYGISGGVGSPAYNSTLTNNAVYYFDQIEAKDTWWNKTIASLDAFLCVNNSFSGGRVTDVGDRYLTSNTPVRATQLHRETGESPDVILIYFGTNDYNAGVSLQNFQDAYSTMLSTMKTTYPNAQIFCATIIPSKGSDEMEETTRQQNSAGLTKYSYCEIIKNVASEYDAIVVDLYTELGENYYTTNGINYYYDGVLLKKADGTTDSHPNEKGMQNLCNCFTSAINTWLASK